MLLHNFSNPFVVLIITLGIVSFFLGQYDSVVIISCMVVLTVIMRFIQEYRSNKAAEKLKALVSTKATVLRRGTFDEEAKSHEIDIKHLVPGDIIHLAAGDMVPADVRLIKIERIICQPSFSDRRSSSSGKRYLNKADNKRHQSSRKRKPLFYGNQCSQWIGYRHRPPYWQQYLFWNDVENYLRYRISLF